VIEHALCVLDRDGGGREALAEAGVELHAMLTAADLDAAFEAGLGMEQ
jgi:orotate phosphoribosyltransferase